MPTDDELRAAGIELQVARLRDEMEAALRATRRGRTLLRVLRIWQGIGRNRRRA